MKKILLLFALAFVSLSSYAGGLVPRFVTYDRYYESTRYKPQFFDAFFNEPIGLEEGSEVTVYRGDEVVATDKLKVRNCKDTQGEAFAGFGDGLMLPKGADYRFVVAPDAIHSLEDPTRTNDEIVYEVSIPDYLEGMEHWYMRDSVPTSSQLWDWHWPEEIEAVEGSELLLYRDGEFQCTVPFHTCWDWDTGHAKAAPKSEIHFENGVPYTLVLPEGSVRSYWRDDIVNREDRVDFIGSYVKPIEYPFPFWTNDMQEMIDCMKRGYITKVMYLFHKPIRLGENPEVRLVANDVLLTTVVPTLEVVDPKTVVPECTRFDVAWLVTADFGGYPAPELQPCEWFSIYMPQGTVYYTEGDCAPNMPISGTHTQGSSGIATPGADKACGDVYNMQGMLLMRGATADDLNSLPAGIYIHAGKKVVR